MSKSKSTDHIEEMLEWQEKQYTPWEYSQMGKLPPHLTAPGNKRNAAILCFTQAILGTAFITLSLVFNKDEDSIGKWIFLVILVGYSILNYLAGINYLRKMKSGKLTRKAQRENAHKKVRTRR